MSERIAIKIVKHGELTIEVDREEFERACADGDLRHMYDLEISYMDYDVTIEGRDGREWNV